MLDSKRIAMLDADLPNSGGAPIVPPAYGAADDAKPVQDVARSSSSLPVAMRQLESRLGMLLATFHDDAGFWAAFSRLMLDLDDGLAPAERLRLRSHADFLLVRAGMSSWTLIDTAGAAAVRALAPAAR